MKVVLDILKALAPFVPFLLRAVGVKPGPALDPAPKAPPAK